MELRRKIDAVLAEWKVSSRKRPLIVKGPRQCGKTHSVLKFAREHYRHVVYLNFLEDERYKTVFDGSLRVDEIIKKLSAVVEAPFEVEPGQTILILDEIQDCPEARTALKFIHLDGRMDVIGTGSLLGVKGYGQAPRSIPVGYENHVSMHPLDFEEFLWALQMPVAAIDEIRTCFQNETPVPEPYHGLFRERFLEYAVVGGMPEAVLEFCESKNLGRVQSVHREILADYREDMVKYANREDRAHIVECFASIPAQLAKENKKFQYSVVRKGSKASTFSGSLQWIEDVGIITRCYNVTLPERPLDAVSERNVFKVYMCDPGLLLSMMDDVSPHEILSGNTLIAKGGIFENLIAGVLHQLGYALYYFHKDSGLELDFVVARQGECVPIEVKSTNGNAKSLRTIFNHPEKYNIARAIKFADINVGRVGPIVTLPLYMSFLLARS